ncbi:MAG TPA: hypothetical protein VLF71_01805 [Candidatus Saccharimonadales bacterium]|nr:hypothetical protein [Candidatus Saccharimonadales bacterium]
MLARLPGLNAFQTFQLECSVQGVPLSHAIDPTPVLDTEPVDFPHGPSDSMLRGVTRAATLLRQGEPLVRDNSLRALDLGLFGDDVPMRTLAGMVNGSREAVTAQDSVPSFNGPRPGNLDVCVGAERNWLTVLTGAQDIGDPDQPLAEFFTGADGGVVMARKLWTVPNALTFVGVVIGGVEYPAGSLLALSTRHHGDSRAAPPGYSVRPADEVISAAFLRLSGYALPEGQQAIYGVDSLTNGLEIATVREFAETALGHFPPAALPPAA